MDKPIDSGSRRGEPTLLLIQAGDPLLAEEALGSIMAKLGRTIDLATAVETFRAGEDDMETVLAAAETLPFGSDRRIVILRDAERLKESDLVLLREYAANVVPTSLLMLVAVGLDRKSKLPQVFGKDRTVVVAPKKGDSLRRWLRGRFEERKLGVSEPALSCILENSSGSLSELDHLVDKLRLYYSGSRELGLEDVAPLIAPLASADIYQLPEKIAAGDQGAALKMLRRLFRQEEDPLRILFVLVSHFRTLLAMKSLREEGYRRGDIQARLNLDDWRYQRMLPYLSRYELSRLINIYHQLMQTDMDLKTGAYPDQLAIEMLVARIAEK